MDPRLQAGLELQLDKRAQQEHDSSLSGVLGQHFKQAYGAGEVLPSARDRFEQQGGTFPTSRSLHLPAGDVEQARGDQRFPTQSTRSVKDDLVSRFSNRNHPARPPRQEPAVVPESPSINLPAPTQGEINAQRMQRATDQADIPSANLADILRDAGKRFWHGRGQIN